MMSGDGSGYSAAELADKIRSGEVDANIDAVLTDDDDIGSVLKIAEWADLPDDSPLVEMLSRSAQTDMIRSARKKADVASMNAATGLSETRSDASGYDMLIKACRPAAHQILIKGPKGSGKTTKAFDIAKRLYNDGYIDSILTNVPGPTDHEAVEFAENISTFLEFAKEPGEKLAIFDEFSTSGNAYTGQHDVEQTMSLCINAFRKSDGGSLRTLFIGHQNDNDIHPLVKTQSDVVIQADGKVEEGLIDSISVYRGWDSYFSDESWFRVRGMSDIPNSSPLSFDTNYFAHLEWDLDNPELQIDRGQLIDDWRKYQDEGGVSDTDDGETDDVYLKCRGNKTDGDDCGSTTSHRSGYCHSHRHQWDGESDDPRLSN